MSTPTTSLVCVSKQDALRAAERILVAVASIRAERKEELILEAMSAWRWVTQWSWPFVRRLNRAEAERLVTVEVPDDLMSWEWHWHRWKWEGADRKRCAEHLITAVTLTQDGFVWLNLEDAHDIAPYLS